MKTPFHLFHSSPFLANWDQDTVPLIELLRSDFCVCDTISFRQLTQLKGIVMIMDLSGLSKAMFKACTLSNIRLMISLNDGFPMKIKEIHFINHPSFFGYFYSLAKPFLKKKLVQRVIVLNYLTTFSSWVYPDKFF